MCTLVILRRPEHAWPIIIGANRDEMIDRPALPPDRHWPDRPEVVAGLDRLAGGTWPRLALARPRFIAAPAPDPDGDDYGAWQDLLGDDVGPPDGPSDAALRFRTPHGYGTVSSALVALPAEPSPDRPAVFRYAGWLP